MRGPAPAPPCARALGRLTAADLGGPRYTLHLLSAEAAPAQLALLVAARTWEKGAWRRQFATAAEIGRLAELVATILPGRSLTRDELVAELDRHVTPELAERLGSGWGHAPQAPRPAGPDRQRRAPRRPPDLHRPRHAHRPPVFAAGPRRGRAAPRARLPRRLRAGESDGVRRLAAARRDAAPDAAPVVRRAGRGRRPRAHDGA